jgi:hypothetical protein
MVQVMDQSDSLEFVDLSIFLPADTFKGSQTDALQKKNMSFEVSLQQAIAEAAGTSVLSSSPDLPLPLLIHSSLPRFPNYSISDIAPTQGRQRRWWILSGSPCLRVTIARMGPEQGLWSNSAPASRAS